MRTQAALMDEPAPLDFQSQEPQSGSDPLPVDPGFATAEFNVLQMSLDNFMLHPQHKVIQDIGGPVGGRRRVAG